MNDRVRSLVDTVACGLSGAAAFDDRLGRWSTWFRIRLAVDVVTVVVVAASLPFLLTG